MNQNNMGENMNTTPQSCPVCGAAESRTLLFLQDSPIYLHPVAADAQVPLPHTMSLDYRQCRDCGHAYRVGYDLEQLSAIYRNHYYTPAAPCVGVGVHDEFLDYLCRSPHFVGKTPASSLEIGCSSGEMLADIQNHFGLGDAVVGIEPNHDTASSARKHGFRVIEEFFDADLARTLGTFDLVFSRHVVEHIDGLATFLDSLRLAAGTAGTVILETPSLDWALANANDTAFHVEHLHVFSKASLAAAGAAAGLTLIDMAETSFGNLIAMFRAKAVPLKVPQTDMTTDLQAKHDRRCRWLAERLSKRPVVFWGAGSASRILIQETGCRPAVLCDGNPGKAGKHFVGMSQEIGYAPDVVLAMVERDEDRSHLLVAASTFHEEIAREARRLGWRGDIISLNDFAGHLS
jgi:SAM-dependent methyltransferase